MREGWRREKGIQINSDGIDYGMGRIRGRGEGGGRIGGREGYGEGRRVGGGRREEGEDVE